LNPTNLTSSLRSNQPDNIVAEVVSFNSSHATDLAVYAKSSSSQPKDQWATVLGRYVADPA